MALYVIVAPVEGPERGPCFSCCDWPDANIVVQEINYNKRGLLENPLVHSRKFPLTARFCLSLWILGILQPYWFCKTVTGMDQDLPRLSKLFRCPWSDCWWVKFPMIPWRKSTSIIQPQLWPRINAPDRPEHDASVPPEALGEGNSFENQWGLVGFSGICSEI